MVNCATTSPEAKFKADKKLMPRAGWSESDTDQFNHRGSVASVATRVHQEPVEDIIAGARQGVVEFARLTQHAAKFA
eukprot:8203497-Lingulodinium_polyedra.AAC.1